MDRLLAVSGSPLPVGQPLRPEDLEMIQNVSVESLAAIIKSISDSNNIILWGCVTSVQVNRIYLTEGAIFVGGEIYHVAACNFATIEEGLTYLQPSITTSESRTFKDNTAHNVYQLRRYQGGHATTIPSGGINYTSFSRLSDLQISLIFANIAAQIALISKTSVPYTPSSGYISATAFPYLKITGNSFNLFMLTGAFHATAALGKLCTLPEAYRPSGDFFGVFWAGTGIQTGIIKIKANGEVWINGASTTSVNYVSLLYPKVFDDLVDYDMPTGAGSQ